MSGSGGFYKYRCKNFYSHNCPNWVWVNNSPCATCLAEGKDNEDVPSPSWASRDIVVPRVRDGILQYTMMEIVAPSEPGEGWILRDKDGASYRPPPAVQLASAMPGTYGTLDGWQ